LIAALKDKDSLVRAQAADALGQIKDVRAIEPLIAALKDKDSLVRERAADALGQIKGARAVGS
jgi:HEAT repeat protein